MSSDYYLVRRVLTIPRILKFLGVNLSKRETNLIFPLFFNYPSFKLLTRLRVRFLRVVENIYILLKPLLKRAG